MIEEDSIIKELEEKIRIKNQLPKEEKEKINNKIFKNIALADIIYVFFILIILGYFNIEESKFILDLKVFSIALLSVSIILFEYSYKKDDGNIALYGIEILVLAIYTMISVYIILILKNRFLILEFTSSYIFAIYYIIKSIIIYLKNKKDYIKTASDINEIIKKEQPVKKEKTQKRAKKNI